jgi:hypothetical protein
MRLIRKTALVLLAASLASGCVARLAYNNADSFVLRYARDYVDLTVPQADMVRLIVGDSLSWVGITRSADYATMLRELGDELPALDAAGWEGYLSLGAEYAEELAGVTAPGMARLLLSLSPAQREAMFATLEERNVEMQRERDELADPQAERLERLEAQFRGWLGRLSPQQRALVRSHAAGLESTGEMWLTQRRLWQQTLREALEADPVSSNGEVSGCSRVGMLLIAPQQLWSEPYAAVLERNRQRMVVLLAEFSPTITPVQQQRAQRRLQRYAGTLEGIGQLALRDWQRSCEGADCLPPEPAYCPA